MNQEEKTRIVESYIASSKFALDEYNVLRRMEETDWASQALYAWAKSDPTLVLNLCVLIAQKDDSEEILERVANGPLAAVLKSADDAFLVRVEHQAPDEPALRQLLACVWEDNELSESTWAVVRNNSEE